MKYFILTLFLLFTIVLNAQMNMEEISYIPSPSGYYNNLVVKGNVNIAEIVTYPFNVQSYGSFLNVNISPSKLYIANLTVSTGTVALFSEFTVNQTWNIQVPGQPAQRGALNYIPVTMNGGNLSVSKSKNANSALNIDPITFTTSEAKTPTVNLRTQNLEYAVKEDGQILPFKATNLYILGMEVPRCEKGYYWQPVSVGDKTYTVLACQKSTCDDPTAEETCLARGCTYRNCNCGSPC